MQNYESLKPWIIIVMFYLSYNFSAIQTATLHRLMRLALYQAKKWLWQTVQILAYNCEVDQESISIKESVSF